MIWIQFIICAASLLAKYGDVIAEKTGLGRAWIGAILIAGVPSPARVGIRHFVGCLAEYSQPGCWRNSGQQFVQLAISVMPPGLPPAPTLGS